MFSGDLDSIFQKMSWICSFDAWKKFQTYDPTNFSFSSSEKVEKTMTTPMPSAPNPSASFFVVKLLPGHMVSMKVKTLVGFRRGQVSIPSHFGGSSQDFGYVVNNHTKCSMSGIFTSSARTSRGRKFQRKNYKSKKEFAYRMRDAQTISLL